MSSSPRCPSCGRPLSFPLPALCPGCDSFTDRPPEVAAPEPGAETLLKGTTADDGNPYTVIGGKPMPRCPECNARLPFDDAPNCERCGWDRNAGRKLPKTYPPIHRTWEAGWSLQMRVIAFAICQILNVATAAFIYNLDGRAVTSTGGFLVMVICQAVVLGTFDRLDLTRTAKGKVTLTQQWRIAFWPLEPKTLRWRECEEIRVLHAETGMMEWIMFFGLLPSVVPALLLVLVRDPARPREGGVVQGPRRPGQPAVSGHQHRTRGGDRPRGERGDGPAVAAAWGVASAMPMPTNWQNPITARPGQTQSGVDPARLLPSRGDLDRSRLEAQRRLLRSGIRRFSPVQVTPDGVIFDGHHMVRAAAEEGKLIDVRVVGISQPPGTDMILDLPVR